MPTTARPVTGPDGDNPITDEQIRELRCLCNETAECLTHRDVNRIAGIALGLGDPRRVRDARKRCASVWDARHALRVVTANTITDTQIRELRGTAVDRGDVGMWRTCDVALGGDDADLAMTREEALTGCAAALNARQGRDQ
jgi:hypothetical protein